jgi:hypothetical protein
VRQAFQMENGDMMVEKLVPSFVFSYREEIREYLNNAK